VQRAISWGGFGAYLDGVDSLDATGLRPEEVRDVRYRLKQSQAEFALMIGVSVATLQSWEEGRHRPDGPADALGAAAKLGLALETAFLGIYLGGVDGLVIAFFAALPPTFLIATRSLFASSCRWPLASRKK